MAAIKLHAGVFSDPGTDSCDFRGRALPDETRRTIAELDPADDDTIAFVLDVGPKLNTLLDAASPSESIGLEAGLRIGVWDE